MHNGKSTFTAWTRLFFDDLTDVQIHAFNGRPRADPRRWGMGLVVR